MGKVVNLMFVDGINANNNKYYNMFDNEDGTFTSKYGRVGGHETNHTYPISKWNSTLKSKVRKGYKDVSDLMQHDTVTQVDSGNAVFEDFYKHFSKYAKDMTNKTYLVNSCTPQQLKEAQDILNAIANSKKGVTEANLLLQDLFKVIPRRMDYVPNYLISTNTKDFKKDIAPIIKREQDALDAMDSTNIVQKSNVLESLGIEFYETTAKEHKMLEELINPSNTGYRNAKIYKTYKVVNKTTQTKFDNWLATQQNKKCELLFHGTRNPNIFSILKSGLLVRPSNAASFAGSAYGDGVYHSAHTAKSLGYTGWDTDKIFFIQNVHMGNFYTYSGYYRDNKDISRSQMNYKGLQELGHDSLYVKAGDGLLNSEYIVYNSEQTTTNYLVWFK